MASVPDSSLEAGLAALRCGDYPTAIIHLETVCQIEQNQTSQVKAQMSLVVAYERISEINRAIALCQTLSNSINPQVREWAVRNHARLANLHFTAEATNSTTPEVNRTGFVAFNSPPVKSQKSEVRSQESEKLLLFSAPPDAFEWRQAERAKRWQSLDPVNLVPLWLLQFGTAIALFWLIRELLRFAMAGTNALLVKLPYLEPFQLFYRDPTQFVLLTLGILISLLPWLLDKLLQLFYGLQPLSINTLSTHSLEASRMLQRYCRQRRWSLPQLGILPTSAPVALTYGNFRCTAKIVVSQGLLDRLADDEIATIYASQLGHIAHGDFVVMSLVILVTQLPYTIYRQVSQWGDRRSNVILRSTAVAITSLAYSIWLLLSGCAVWLSQLRLYYSDRLSAEITGNPNALSRALLKISQGIVLDIQQQGHTSWLLESLNLLSPVGNCQAITLGSFQSSTQLELILAWDYLNPNRYWLTINNTHPLIGDRLHHLNQIAHHWHLETELNLLKTQNLKLNGQHASSTPVCSTGGKYARNWLFNRMRDYVRNYFPPNSLRKIRTRLDPEEAPAASLRKLKTQNSKLFLQAAPFLGIALGFAFGCLTWLIGGIGILLQIAQLSWMYGDWVIIKGCLPIGFSIGTFVRINSFFPDIKPSTVQTNSSLPDLLATPTALPVDSQPVRLHGKLLGRRGISNWLGQDLILHSSTGLVKLHHFSWLGPIGNLLHHQVPSFTELVEQNLIVTGWFRRGATSWLDINTLRQKDKISRSAHPVWSTILATTAAAWGVYILLGDGG
jgi:Zn-dependent protease with chaperone function